MTVRVRLNRGDGGLHRRWRSGRGAHTGVRPDGKPRIGTTAHAEIARGEDDVPPQDQALYTCQCGLTFEAPVSTSVGCPHCGSTQAW